jgi:soluble lytic murein transglycosylase
LQSIGNDPAARAEFSALIAAGGVTPAPARITAAMLAEARYRLAQSYLREDTAAEAATILAQLLATADAGDPWRSPALFLLGEALLSAGRPADAEASFRAYLSLAPEATSLTWQRIGAARRAAGNLAAAAEAYSAALAASPDWETTCALRRSLADLALAQRDYTGATAQYDRLRGDATTGAAAAELQWLAGSALAAGGDKNAAASRWQAAADADPTSRYAHQALVALLDAGVTVNEYQRGLVNYHNGVYALAVAAFDRFLAADATSSAALSRQVQDALYYRGLSYLALGQSDRGSAELERFIAAYPTHPLWPEAWLAQARAQARAGRATAAIATYRRLAAERPAAAQAPRALWQAATLQAGLGEPAATIEAYLDLARRYPAADEGWRAYLAAGLAHFRTGDMAAAASVWAEMATAPALAAWTRPVAYFWLGRAQAAAGDAATAARSWQAAVAAGASSFYGQRAAAWLAGDGEDWGSGRASAAPGASVVAPSGDLVAWLATWAGPGALELPAAVLTDPDWQRGQTLALLGRRSEALTAWERVLRRRSAEPWSLAALALAFGEMGAPRLGIVAAEQLLARWGGAVETAPAAVLRLAYPLPYLPLLREEAGRWRLDPRLLAAVIRQESRFEAVATSSAGAQGLMQVMPATAEWIAGRLARADLRADLAYRPYVNVAFGAYYLHYTLELLDGSLPSALAGYNGGPGRAQAWRKLAPTDDDLMAALIDISETRIYVQTVWAQYKMYQRLYDEEA